MKDKRKTELTELDILLNKSIRPISIPDPNIRSPYSSTKSYHIPNCELEKFKKGMLKILLTDDEYGDYRMHGLGRI